MTPEEAGQHRANLETAEKMRAGRNPVRHPSMSEIHERQCKEHAERVAEEQAYLKSLEPTPAEVKSILLAVRALARMWGAVPLYGLGQLVKFIQDNLPELDLEEGRITCELRKVENQAQLVREYETALFATKSDPNSFRLITLAQHGDINFCRKRLAQRYELNVCSWCGISEHGWHQIQDLALEILPSGNPGNRFFHRQGGCLNAWREMQLRVRYAPKEAPPVGGEFVPAGEDL